MRMQEQFDRLFKEIAEMKAYMHERFFAVENRMDAQEKTTDKLVSRFVGFESYVHENMVTKKEAADDKAEIMSRIDLLAQRGSLHEDERLAGTVRFERIEDRVTRLEHRASPS
jgi:hypothetical protein